MEERSRVIKAVLTTAGLILGACSKEHPEERVLADSMGLSQADEETLAEAIMQGLCGPPDSKGAEYLASSYGERELKDLAPVMQEVQATLNALQDEAFSAESQQDVLYDDAVSPGYQDPLEGVPDGAIVRSIYTPIDGGMYRRRSAFLRLEKHPEVYQVRDALVLLTELTTRLESPTKGERVK